MPDAFVAGWTRQQGRVDAALARVAELEKNLPKTADGVVVQDGMTLHHKTDDDETLRKFAFASLIEIDGDFVESCYGVGDCYSTRAAALSAK